MILCLNEVMALIVTVCLLAMSAHFTRPAAKPAVVKVRTRN